MRAAFEAVFLSILVGDVTSEAEPFHRPVPLSPRLCVYHHYFAPACMRAAFEAVFISILVGDATAEAEPCHRSQSPVRSEHAFAPPFCASQHTYGP